MRLINLQKMKQQGKILPPDTLTDKNLLASIMDESDSDSDDSRSSQSKELDEPLQQEQYQQEEPQQQTIDENVAQQHEQPDTLSADDTEAFPDETIVQTDQKSFDHLPRVKDFFNVEAKTDAVKFREPINAEVVLQNPYLDHLQDNEPLSLKNKIAELAVNLSSKTAEAIAKPLLEIISKPSPISDQPTNTEEEKEVLSATFKQANFLDDSFSPENKNLRSRTLAGRPNQLYKTFSMPVDYHASSFVEDLQQDAQKGKNDDNDELSEDAEKRLLRQIEQESDSDDSNESSDDQESQESQDDQENADEKVLVKDNIECKQGSENGSMVSEEDILNRSLHSDGDEAIVSANYLRYASEKYAQKQDLLEIVDKNERSFKQVAEKMISQSSQLVNQTDEVMEGNAPKRRLMHMTPFKKIAERFHGDIKVAQGVPYSIAALEDILAIGSSDGSVRLFDNSEQEIKVLSDKSVKGHAVTCLDMKRIGDKKDIFVAAGHAKGQISMYIIKGLFQQAEFLARQNSNSNVYKLQDNLFGNVQAKHCKTIDDISKSTIVTIKFVGEFNSIKDINVLTSDLQGVVFLSTFSDGILTFSCNKVCIMRNRLGPSYSLAPLLDQGLSQSNQAYQNVVKKVDQNALRQMQQQQPQQDNEKRMKPIIIGFGTLEEIYVAQIVPKAIPLLSVRRPPYISSGTVPYLDWGEALTPTYRDQAYPVITIAWGRTIQLGVLPNHEAVKAGKQEPQIELDGFYICDGVTIDQCFFLSESLLFIIVNKKEVRILYTQNFTPGAFEPDYVADDLRTRKKGADGTSEEDQAAQHNFTKLKEKYAGQVSSYAEKDKGYSLLEDEIRHKEYSLGIDDGELKSKFNFNPTVCKNNDQVVIALGKTTIGQQKQIHWEEYLDLFRRTYTDDWLKVLRAALDIYNGKMVGFAGLPDQREKREVLLRERMKDLLRQNIDACIREFQEGECVSKKTLRVATEFCIRVGAIDHLFGELFRMFAEAGMEQRYFENLDAFIISGVIKTKVPDHILTRLIDFYRQKDVELLEKAILNLDLKKYPGIEKVRHICEEEFLSSALIHLLTTLFDGERDEDIAICLSILCSLFNLMTRSQVVKTKQEIMQLIDLNEKQGTSLFEASTFDRSNNVIVHANQRMTEEQKQLQQHLENRKKKLEIEHSCTYIGYKLLWVITLFLEGKKFPSGQLSAFKWRCYIYDIVRFCTNEKFMAWFLNFDPEAFFSVLKRVFLDTEPQEYISSQHSFIAFYKEEVPGLEPCMTHEQIIQTLDQQVQKKVQEDIDENEGRISAKGEELANAFMFFVTHVGRKPIIKIPEELGLRIVKEQIFFHKKLLKLPKEELKELIPKTKVISSKEKVGSADMKKIKDKTYFIYTFLIKKNEKDVIQLLNRFQHDLSEEKIRNLLDEAKSAPMFKLQVILHQWLGNYQRCLSLFFQELSIKADVFQWLSEVHQLIESGAEIMISSGTNESFTSNEDTSSQKSNKPTRQRMKALIIENIADFVQMDPEQTVKLCQDWFNSDYEKMARALQDQKTLAFSFLNTVISVNQALIIQGYNNSVMAIGQQDSTLQDKFIPILLIFVELLCEKKFRPKIVEFVSRNYFPVDQCLKICEEKGALEASAVLQRRRGAYQESIELYVQVLVELCAEQLFHIIFGETNILFQDPKSKNEHIQRFDGIILNIIKICEKYGSTLGENESKMLWLFSIKQIFQIKTLVYEKLQGGSDSESEEESELEERMTFEKFLVIRNQYFMQRMSEYVNLRVIIQFLKEQGHAMKYQEFRSTFEDKVQSDSYFEQILENAKTLLKKDIGADTYIKLNHLTQGISQREMKCSLCKQRFNTWFDNKEDIWLFKCEHVFHARCVAKNEGMCSLCFNELDAFSSILTSSKATSKFKQQKESKVAKSRTSSIDSGPSTSSQSSEIDEFEIARRKIQNQLQRSKTQVGEIVVKRETKEEKKMKQLLEFDAEHEEKHLKIINFKN